jgi:hypothetical protein
MYLQMATRYTIWIHKTIQKKELSRRFVTTMEKNFLKKSCTHTDYHTKETDQACGDVLLKIQHCLDHFLIAKKKKNTKEERLNKNTAHMH